MADIATREFGVTGSGLRSRLYTLRNAAGGCLDISDFGATIVRLQAPDRHGQLADVVLGYDCAADYEFGNAYMGGTIGRVANRISHARFEIDGSVCQLEPNLGEHHLHSAAAGTHLKRWQAEVDRGALLMRCVCADGDGGYPGQLSLAVRFQWSDAYRLQIDYRAVTDRATPVNLTNHSYFNLAGHQCAGHDGALAHRLQLHASHYLPTDAQSIPLNRLESVHGTPLDFRQSVAVGARIDQPFEQLLHGSGYDHCWVADAAAGGCNEIARVLHDSSGRCLTVATTQPGVQFYSGNFIADISGKQGAEYNRRGALCLETQHFPDAVNQPAFPSVIVRPGQTYQHTSVYQFSVIDNPVR